MQGVTTNCYEPEELQSLCSDSDEEEDLLEPIVQEDEGRQVVDEQQQSNGRGEVNTDSGGDEENQVVPEEVVDEQNPETHVESGPNNPDEERRVIDLTRDTDSEDNDGLEGDNENHEEDLIDLTKDSGDEQVVDDRLVKRIQEMGVSDTSVQQNTADQVASDGRQTAGNESHLGNSYDRFFFLFMYKFF